MSISSQLEALILTDVRSIVSATVVLHILARCKRIAGRQRGTAALTITITSLPVARRSRTRQ